MTAATDPTDGGRSPDHATCQHCGQPISWDEVCYVHDANGFADCGLTISGGLILTEAQLTGSPRSSRTTELTVNPTLTVDPAAGGHRAEPVEWAT